jgi:thiamine pyrophosphate-dependent acetolactate synthase large subunit-like protein
MGAQTRVLGVQGFDIVRMMRNHTKYAMRPRTWSETERALQDGYSEALRPRQGPAWIDLSRDLVCLNP